MRLSGVSPDDLESKRFCQGPCVALSPLACHVPRPFLVRSSAGSTPLWARRILDNSIWKQRCYRLILQMVTQETLFSSLALEKRRADRAPWEWIRKSYTSDFFIIGAILKKKARSQSY
ncbi:hypothetical protein BaRGS_00004879 [Batillaria attramentaria]|uniref:Uncharacterized protein n=1 Tax=Batillaria attramentaria TaxID=370345 RepID=A0ABD0LW69_9CAEN